MPSERTRSPRRSLRAHAAKGVALLLVAAAFLVARVPEPGADEVDALASAFSFTPLELEPPPGLPMREDRDLHPDYEGIQAWMSSVGAGVAVTDLDGDGLMNDLCYVDPRVDRALVAPAPTGPSRYAPFALDTGDLPYDDTMAPMGCQPVDADADGRMDLLVYYWGRSPSLHMAGGDAPSADAYEAVELLDGGYETWHSNAALTADVDGDGTLDLVIGNYFPDDAAVLDTSGGGRPTMQHSMSRAANAGENRLLLGSTDPDGPLFTEAGGVLEGRASTGWTLALGAADLDGDMLPELYVSNDFGPDVLLRNDSVPGDPSFTALGGTWTPTTAGSKVLGEDSFKGMGIDFGDLDGDGRLDMAVSNITEEFALFESNFIWMNTDDDGLIAEGRAPFRDRSEQLGLARSGWGWDIRFTDLDNDGHKEVVQATGFVAGEVNRWPEIQEVALVNDELLADPRVWPDLGPETDLSGDGGLSFFAREGGQGRFAEIGDHVGVGRSTVSRGVAMADTDGDGLLDIAVANQWDTSVLYRNDSPDPGASVSLNLVRPAEHGTTPAVGTAVRVTAPDGRVHVAQVDGGNGHSGKHAPELVIGLGEAADEDPVPVELTWRDDRGRVHTAEVVLTPGRHTVVLTDGAEASETGSGSGS
ncbi:CRTAC1 family protein [Nocardiopsis tropica]|uniref:FG-GAP repeat domain-containing protein n=1 Tax=Nocardiopsis tropica TaxID=109330 RepID=UPI0031E08465